MVAHKNKKIDNAADERLVNDQRDSVKIERDQLLEDIRKIIHTPEGYRYMKYMIKMGSITDISAHLTSVENTYFNEGHRNYAKILFTDIADVAPELTAKILVELTKEDRRL